MDRKIKSFVRRNSRITNSKQQALIDYWDLYGICLPQSVNELPVTEIINFAAIFNNNNPVVLEIGFGNGESLLTMAIENPTLNFVGIEVYKAGIGNVCNKAHINNLQNIKVICGDAIEILTNNINDNAFNKIQLFFPDPWPKKRHHKRRIIRNNFANLMVRKLAPRGTLHIATDWEHYALEILKEFDTNNNFMNINGKGNFTKESRQHVNRPPTKFELRGIRLGHSVFDLEYKCIKS